MIWFYRILFLPIFLLALPYYGWRMLKRGGYGENFAQRFGSGPWPKFGKDHFRIWVQAVSVGELLAVEKLIRQLAEEPKVSIILSTTTSTGYKLARERMSDTVRAVRYFPLDFWWFSKRTWDRIQPDLMIHMESEGWPEHLHQAKQRRVPVVLINARLSDRSFRRLQRFSAGAGFLVSHFTEIIAASPEDRERWKALGAGHTHLSGNLKVDATPSSSMGQSELSEWRASTGLGEGPILLGSSTWPGEEKMLIDVLERFRAKKIPLRLVLVPRHAERRGEIRKLLEGQTRTYRFRSDATPYEEQKADGDIFVADSTGELSRWTQIADVVIVGKSFPPHQGGQTPVEAALLEKPVIMGPHMENFRAIVRGLKEAGAAWQVDSVEDLQELVERLVLDLDQRDLVVDAARRWQTLNRGATERTLSVLKNYFCRKSEFTGKE